MTMHSLRSHSPQHRLQVEALFSPALRPVRDSVFSNLLLRVVFDLEEEGRRASRDSVHGEIRSKYGLSLDSAAFRSTLDHLASEELGYLRVAGQGDYSCTPAGRHKILRDVVHWREKVERQFAEEIVRLTEEACQAPLGNLRRAVEDVLRYHAERTSLYTAMETMMLSRSLRTRSGKLGELLDLYSIRGKEPLGLSVNSSALAGWGSRCDLSPLQARLEADEQFRSGLTSVAVAIAEDTVPGATRRFLHTFTYAFLAMLLVPGQEDIDRLLTAEARGKTFILDTNFIISIAVPSDPHHDTCENIVEMWSRLGSRYMWSNLTDDEIDGHLQLAARQIRTLSKFPQVQLSHALRDRQLLGTTRSYFVENWRNEEVFRSAVSANIESLREQSLRPRGTPDSALPSPTTLRERSDKVTRFWRSAEASLRAFHGDDKDERRIQHDVSLLAWVYGLRELDDQDAVSPNYWVASRDSKLIAALSGEEVDARSLVVGTRALQYLLDPYDVAIGLESEEFEPTFALSAVDPFWIGDLDRGLNVLTNRVTKNRDKEEWLPQLSAVIASENRKEQRVPEDRFKQTESETSV